MSDKKKRGKGSSAHKTLAESKKFLESLEGKPRKTKKRRTKSKKTTPKAKNKFMDSVLNFGKKKEVKKKRLSFADSIRKVLKSKRKKVTKAPTKKKPKVHKKPKNISKIHLKRIAEQRAAIKSAMGSQLKAKKPIKKYVKTGIAGFDELLEKGIPRGNTLLIAGGAGSGKTIFCLQTMYHQSKKGYNCLYMSFEEREGRLIQHMTDFKMKVKPLLEEGNMKIQRFNPFDISRSVDALLTKAKGELLIDIDPVLLPRGFTPDFVFLDSLTAIASAFTGREDSYRIYIEQLFRFFEKMNATTFLITETEQIPKIFSPTGVEEFLADGVVVLYNFKKGVRRENAIEVLKLRGAKHEKKIVTMQIVPGKGIEVYPNQEIYGDFGRESDVKIK